MLRWGSNEICALPSLYRSVPAKKRQRAMVAANSMPPSPPPPLLARLPVRSQASAHALPGFSPTCTCPALICPAEILNLTDLTAFVNAIREYVAGLRSSSMFAGLDKRRCNGKSRRRLYTRHVSIAQKVTFSIQRQLQPIWNTRVVSGMHRRMPFVLHGSVIFNALLSTQRVDYIELSMDPR